MSVTNLDTVDVARSDRVAWISLNRPDALNAWTHQLGRELTAAIDEAAADPAVRVIVVTGAGRAFSSGADLKAGHAPGQPDDSRAAESGEAGRRAGDRREGKVDVQTALREIYNPLILRVRTVPK